MLSEKPNGKSDAFRSFLLCKLNYIPEVPYYIWYPDEKGRAGCRNKKIHFHLFQSLSFCYSYYLYSSSSKNCKHGCPLSVLCIILELPSLHKSCPESSLSFDYYNGCVFICLFSMWQWMCSFRGNNKGGLPLPSSRRIFQSKNPLEASH